MQILLAGYYNIYVMRKKRIDKPKDICRAGALQISNSIYYNWVQNSTNPEIKIKYELSKKKTITGG